jgi:small subunit ribosomal protein S1
MKRRLEIIRSPHAGYCFGVKRAMRLIEQGARTPGEIIYTLGDVIHNPPEVARLRAAGVRSVSSLEEVPAGATLVLRAHGVHPDLIADAARRRVRIIDATCPFVQRSQQFVKRFLAESRRGIIIGDRDHPEVQSIAGHAGDDVIIVKTIGEAEAIGHLERAGVVIQTTFSRIEAERIIAVLERTVDDLRVHDTICQATEARREATLVLARRVDLMLVVGGRNSSNTNGLYQMCVDAGVPTRFVETAGEIEPVWFHGVRRVGLTTGTSTPDWIIDEVIGRLNEIAGDDSERGS